MYNLIIIELVFQDIIQKKTGRTCLMIAEENSMTEPGVTAKEKLDATWIRMNCLVAMNLITPEVLADTNKVLDELQMRDDMRALV